MTPYWEVRIHQVFSGESLSIVRYQVRTDEPQPTLMMMEAIEQNAIPGPGLYATVIDHYDGAAHFQKVYLSDVAPNPQAQESEHGT